jgi:hypothetical protein
VRHRVVLPTATTGGSTASERTLAAQGIAAERLDVATAARLYPSFAGDDLAFVLLEPEAGVLRAQRAVRALAAQAAAHGATVVEPASTGSWVNRTPRLLEPDAHPAAKPFAGSGPRAASRSTSGTDADANRSSVISVTALIGRLEDARRSLVTTYDASSERSRVVAPMRPARAS